MVFSSGSRPRILAGLLLAGFSLYQLFCVLVYGQVFSGPYGNIRWVTHADAPQWFWGAIAVYSLLILFVGAYFYALMRWGER